jgi:hypothetical protein
LTFHFWLFIFETEFLFWLFYFGFSFLAFYFSVLGGAMIAINFTLLFILGFLAGVAGLLGYILWRMMRNDGWDDSNITNALRLLSHVTLHAEDFGKMYYLTRSQARLVRQLFPEENIKRPFWYTSEDELEGVVKTRPTTTTGEQP